MAARLRRYRIGLAAVGSIVTVLALTFLVREAAPGNVGSQSGGVTLDAPVIAGLGDVLRHTDLVLVATFETEAQAVVEQPPPGGAVGEGTSLIREHLSLWTLHVEKVVAGEHGDAQAQVVIARSLDLPGPAGGHSTLSWDAPTLEPGSAYILFLSHFPAPDYYPKGWTGTLYGLAVPGVGTVEGRDFVLAYSELDAASGSEESEISGTLDAIPDAWERARSASPAAAQGDSPDPEVTRRGGALERLVATIQASSLTADEAVAAAHAERLDARSLGDAAFCRKVEAVVLGETGVQLALGCEAP